MRDNGTQTECCISTDLVSSDTRPNNDLVQASSPPRKDRRNWQYVVSHKLFNLESLLDDFLLVDPNAIPILTHSDTEKPILLAPAYIYQFLDRIIWDIGAVVSPAPDMWKVIQQRISSLYEMTENCIDRKPVEALRLLNCLIHELEQWKRCKMMPKLDKDSSDSQEDESGQSDDDSDDNGDEQEDDNSDDTSNEDGTGDSSISGSDEEMDVDEAGSNSRSSDQSTSGSDHSNYSDESEESVESCKDDEEDRNLAKSTKSHHDDINKFPGPSQPSSPSYLSQRYPCKLPLASSNSSSSLASDTSPTLDDRDINPSPSPEPYTSSLRGAKRRPPTKTDKKSRIRKHETLTGVPRKKDKYIKPTNRAKHVDMTENCTQQGLGTLQDLGVVPLG